MVGKDRWALIAKRKPATESSPALWRVTYGDAVGLTHEQYMARREEKFREMLPGHPEPHQYSVEQTDQFKTHNRCVDSMRQGRVLLAADAAHVCTPYGGYGCMTAILDVDGLVECFVGIKDGKADDTILTKWADIRRDLFMRYVGPRSIKNMRRLADAETIDDDKFMVLLKELGEDDEQMKAFLLVSHSIKSTQTRRGD